MGAWIDVAVAVDIHVAPIRVDRTGRRGEAVQGISREGTLREEHRAATHQVDIPVAVDVAGPRDMGGAVTRDLECRGEVPRSVVDRDLEVGVACEVGQRRAVSAATPATHAVEVSVVVDVREVGGGASDSGGLHDNLATRVLPNQLVAGLGEHDYVFVRVAVEIAGGQHRENDAARICGERLGSPQGHRASPVRDADRLHDLGRGQDRREVAAWVPDQSHRSRGKREGQRVHDRRAARIGEHEAEGGLRENGQVVQPVSVDVPHFDLFDAGVRLKAGHEGSERRRSTDSVDDVGGDEEIRGHDEVVASVSVEVRGEQLPALTIEHARSASGPAQGEPTGAIVFPQSQETVGTSEQRPNGVKISVAIQVLQSLEGRLVRADYDIRRWVDPLAFLGGHGYPGQGDRQEQKGMSVHKDLCRFGAWRAGDQAP